MSENRTNIEYFNYYYKLFINSILDIFPEYKEITEEYYNNLLNNDSYSNEDKYVKRFMKKFSNFKSEISNKDKKLFENNIFFIKNIDFKKLWDSEELSVNNKNKIWEYLQTLFILGETIISDSERIKHIINNFNNDTNETEPKDEDKEILNMLNNLKQNSENMNNNIIENGLLGKLAKELTEEINLDDMNINLEKTDNIEDLFGNMMKGDGALNFMNLIQTVGQKIKTKVDNGEFNEGDLFGEATKMMGDLKNNNLFKNLEKMNNQANNQANNQSNNQNDKPIIKNKTQERLRKKLEEKEK